MVCLRSSPQLHILIPTYGDSSYFKETLISIKSTFGVSIQEGLVIVSVIDDSREKLFESILEAFGEPNFEYIRNKERLGLEGNFNRCLELTRGQYTMFLGCDDFFLPGFYEEFCRVVQKPAHIYALGVKVVNEFGRQSRSLVDLSKKLLTPGIGENVEKAHSGDRFLARLLIGNFLYFPSLIWETKSLKNYKFDSNAGVVVDLELIARMLFDGHSILISKRPQSFAYRRHLRSESSIQKFTKQRFQGERSLSYALARKAMEMGWWRSFLFGRLLLTARIHHLISRI
jgi:glycosyltransferase involved in cell wall biosynthesis